MEAQAAKERERLQAEEKAHARRMAAAGEAGKDDQARNFREVDRYILRFWSGSLQELEGPPVKEPGRNTLFTYTGHRYSNPSTKIVIGASYRLDAWQQ